MLELIIVVILFVLLLVSTIINQRSRDSKRTDLYHYTRKNYVMTKAENEFFDVICRAVGGEFLVFPQVHLSEFLNNDVKGQYRLAALHYINQKSVDYLICDKSYRKPLVAIELDDWSHDNEDRQERDANVERVLQEAGVPLLRFRDVRDTPTEELASQIRAAL